MNTKTIQLPIKREHRRAATIFTLAAILGVVISATDIHRTIFGIVWNAILPVLDTITGY
jgi:hypothetical protein